MRRLFLALLLKYCKWKTRRLREKNLRLSAEIEAATGAPAKLTAEEKNRLRKLAQRVDPELLREIATLDLEDDDS